MVDWKHYGQEEQKEAYEAFKKVINSKIYDMSFKDVDNFFDYKLPLHSAIKFYLHCSAGFDYKNSRDELFETMVNYLSMYNFFPEDFLLVLCDRHYYTMENSKKLILGEDNDYSEGKKDNVGFYIKVLRYMFGQFGKDLFVYAPEDIAQLSETVYNDLPDKCSVKKLNEDQLKRVRNTFKETIESIDEYRKKKYDMDKTSVVKVRENLDVVSECIEITNFIYDGEDMVIMGCDNIKCDGYIAKILCNDLNKSYLGDFIDVLAIRNTLQITVHMGSFIYCNDCLFLITIICILLLDYGWCNLVKIH